MKILFIAPRFHSNQLSLLRKLLEENHVVDFYVIGTGVSENYEFIRPKKIPLTTHKNRFFGRNYPNPKTDFVNYAELVIPRHVDYYRMIKNFNPDVIIIRGATVPRYSYIAILYGLINNTRIVFYTQGAKYVKSLSISRKIHDIFFIKILKFSWFTPVLCRTDSIAGLINIDTIKFIPFFIYPKKYKRKPIAPHEIIKFLCVAKYEERKNIKLLLEVFNAISQHYKNFTLTVVGATGTPERDFYLSGVSEYVRSNGLNEIIELHANVPNQLMVNYYERNDVMILPSVNEPASYSQLEAMAEGMAIICSNDNGSAHYVKHRENGFVVNPTFENLTETIELYLNNFDLVTIHGKRSSDIVWNEYNINESYVKLIELLSAK